MRKIEFVINFSRREATWDNACSWSHDWSTHNSPFKATPCYWNQCLNILMSRREKQSAYEKKNRLITVLNTIMCKLGSNYTIILILKEVYINKDSFWAAVRSSIARLLLSSQTSSPLTNFGSKMKFLVTVSTFALVSIRVS